MPAFVTTDQIWRQVERRLFAVLGVSTARGEPRTVGVCYVVRNRKLYIVTGRATWKARHIEENRNVSLTIPIPKRLPFLPWIQIPAATITLQGEATIHRPGEIPAEIPMALLRGTDVSPDLRAGMCIIEVAPKGEFLTYGIGVSLLTMRNPEAARGRAPV